MDRLWVSRKGIDALHEKRQRLVAELETLRGHMIESFNSDSDLRENPDFMELRMKSMYAVPRQVKELDEVLTRVQVIEDSDEYLESTWDTVQVGSRVCVDYGDGDTETYTILGYDEGQLEENTISYLSPLGQALLGRRVGESALMVTPDGRHIGLKITTIEKGL